jgi:hypothetical protein
MLFDPLEKQLHLPAAAIEVGNRDGRQEKVEGIDSSIPKE